MARNQEKGAAMLNRWYDQERQLKERNMLKKQGIVVPDTLDRDEEKRTRRMQEINRLNRPKYASDCFSVEEAEFWRKEIITELTEKIEAIQADTLEDEAIKELNDRINSLVRAKYLWEKRCHELGSVSVPSLPEKNLKYQFYGAARDLPGFKEMVEKQAEAFKRDSKEELLARVTDDYFDPGETPEMLEAERLMEEAKGVVHS